MKEFLKKNTDYIIIGIVSIIAFTIGCLAINVWLSLLIIGLADLILFIPNLIKSRKKVEKSRHASTERKKEKKKKIKTNNSKEIKKEDKKDKKKKKKRKIFKTLIFIFLLLCIAGILAFCAFWGYIVDNAPKFDPEELYHQEASTLYDIDGKEFAKLGTENREIITYEELPEVLIDAIVATEDSRFYQHNGFDLPRFSKATLQTLLGSNSAGGASTLTMQLVKNHYTSTQKSITRKFTDIYMAINQVEKKYTKEDILEFYVNAPYLGGRSYGVEQACKTYFGKSAKDINLAEAALIAGLFQSPGSDDPTRNPENAEKRRQIVLKLMERHGYITKEEREAASKLTVDKLLVKDEDGDSTVNEYQGFIDTVIEELEKDGLDPYKNALEVYTTMDRDKQDYINDIMTGKTWNWKDEKATAGIAVVDVDNGELLAVGAGRDKTKERTFNTATQLNNQIGSTAKPLFDYAIGIEYENWSTYEPFTDENITYSDGTSLSNWDGGYMGFLTLRRAMAESRNTSAVKAFKKNKSGNIKEAVTKMGLHPESNLHQAHAIGGYTGECPVTMAAAYATFANGGVYNSPHSYTKVIDKNTGEETKKKVTTTKVFSKQTAYIMTNLLQDSAKRGLLNYSNINGTVYGAKTGTSNFDEKTKKARKLSSNAINDYWVSGTSPDYAVSIWYGYEKPNKKYHNVFGTTYHERLFQKVGKGMFKKGSKFKNPGGVSKVAVEKETYPAKLASEYTPKDLIVTELFKSGTEPTETSERFSKLANVTNLTNSLQGNQLTLSWTEISTPYALDETKTKELAKSLFETKGFQNKFVSSRKSYNNKKIGSVVYKIYGKKADGTLELLDTTSSNTITLTVNSESAETYVVKTSYTIFTKNMSDGVETTTSLAGVTDSIELKLVGDATITTPKGTYLEEGIKIVKNGEETDLTPTSTTYSSTTGTPTTLDLMNSTIGSYIVTYNYNEKTITRNVNITQE
ncbi:MAG: hypothetical protein E7157_05020 [Lactobacillales bacterium]|nr:hypothetical protein [Lactobacillales bacterium]